MQPHVHTHTHTRARPRSLASSPAALSFTALSPSPLRRRARRCAGVCVGFAQDGPDPIAVEWGVAFRMGPKSATLKAVRTAMFKASPLNPALAAIKSVDGHVTQQVREAFEHYDRDASGLLDRRELSNALTHLGFDGGAESTAATMRTYDEGEAKLGIGAFNRMAQELHAIAEAEADRAIASQEPVLPLRLFLCAPPPGGASWGMVGDEAAFAEFNVARGRDLIREEVLLLSPVDVRPPPTPPNASTPKARSQPHRPACRQAAVYGSVSISLAIIVPIRREGRWAPCW